MGYPHYTVDCYEYWRVTTICGSMRFYDRMLEVAERLTLEGWLVFMPFVRKDGSMNPTNLAHQNSLGSKEAVGEFLDAMHRQKIDLSRSIHVVSDGSGYIGDSTRAEIAYADSLDKRVIFVHVD